MKFFILLGLVIVLTSVLGKETEEDNELDVTSDLARQEFEVNLEDQEIQNRLVDDRRRSKYFELKYFGKFEWFSIHSLIIEPRFGRVLISVYS